MIFRTEKVVEKVRNENVGRMKTAYMRTTYWFLFIPIFTTSKILERTKLY